MAVVLDFDRLLRAEGTFARLLGEDVHAVHVGIRKTKAENVVSGFGGEHAVFLANESADDSCFAAVEGGLHADSMA